MFEMLYLYLESNSIRLLYIKKSMLGQYETSFQKKTFPSNIIDHSIPEDCHILSLEIKDVLNNLPNGQNREKDVVLILPQKTFAYFSEELPDGLSSEAITQFVNTQARTKHRIDSSTSYCDFVITQSEEKKKASFYAITHETLKIYKKTLSLCGLELNTVIPDTLSYFTLFEKTLRKNKTEKIWYVRYENDRISSYLYDSFGLLPESYWEEPMPPGRILEKILHKKAAEYLAKETKINRLIISGKSSETIRQDTFTKQVGVWTNPLKKIIPTFYADYLKLLTPQIPNAEVPVLSFDMILGAFIFVAENKQFSLTKNSVYTKEQVAPLKTFKLPRLKLVFPIKTMVFFVLSAFFTYLALVGAASLNLGKIIADIPNNVPNIQFPATAPSPTPSATPTDTPPTPTPTPQIDKSSVRVQILNGSGVKGKATVVKNFLREKGYENILTGNAENFGFEKTVIQTKKDGDRLKDTIFQDIKSEILDEPDFELLDDDSASDIVLIFGQDFR